MPFDWGISQDVTFNVRERGGEAVLFLTLRRVDGEVKAWQRVNRRFVSDIRRQFLLWRTISPKDRQRYIAYGKQLLAGDATADLKPAQAPA